MKNYSRIIIIYKDIKQLLHTLAVFKQALYTPWPFMRWLRLAIGLYLIFIGVTESDFLAGGIGAVFSVLALLNQGCGSSSCASGNCDIPKK